jgi:putative transposase
MVANSSFYSRKVVRSNETGLRAKIRNIAHEFGYTYGKRRIHNELKIDGVSISLARVAKLMKDIGITVKFPKKKHYYPDTGEESIYAPNLLNRQFNPEMAQY